MKNRLTSWTGIIGCILLLTASAQAQTWVSSPGSGDFNTDANWDTVTAPSAGSDVATFGSSAVNNVTLSAPVGVDSLQFNAGAPVYTIDTNGSTLTLGGAGVVNNSGGTENLVNSFVISGPNTFFGSLSFANSASAGNAHITNTGDNSYLQFLDSSTAANSTITNSGSMNLVGSATAGSATITNNDFFYIFGTSTAGAASITNNGFLDLFNTTTLGTATVNNTSGGTLSFFGDPNHVDPGSSAGSATITTNGAVVFYDNSDAGSAVVSITGGLVSFNDDSTGGSAQFNITNSTGGIDLSSHNGAVTLSSLQGTGAVHMGDNDLALGTGNQSTTYTGVLDDNIYSSSLTKLGTGTLTLTGANTYDGGTNILGGSVVVDTTGLLGTGTVQDNGGLTFIHSASAGSLTYNIGLSGTLDFKNSSTASNSQINNGGSLTFHDTSTAGSAAITNTSLLVFTDSSSTGSTTITTNAGGAVHLDLSSDSEFSRFIFNGSGSFDMSGHTGAVTVQSIEGGEAIALGSNSLVTGFNNLGVTLTGAISGIGGSLTKVGSGALTLTGTSSYSGGTSILGGSLAVNSESAMGASSGALILNGTTLTTLAGITSTRAVDFLSGGTINTNGFNSSFGGNITGSGLLNKSGSGILTLNGTNTYDGGTQVLGGTLALGNTNAIGAGSVSLGGGNFDISAVGGTMTVQSIAGSGNITLGGNDLTTGSNDQSTALTGIISGAGGSLTKVGAGTLTLSGANTYDGATSVLGGALQISADNNMGAAGGLLVMDGTTLRTLGGIVSTRAVSLFGGVSTFDTNGFDSSLGGIIIGSGGLYKSGAGDLTLSSANSYGGGTQISAGTLTVTDPNALGTGTVLLTGGTLAVSGQIAVTWSGDYQQSTGTTLKMGLGGTGVGESDSLNLSGTAILNGTLSLSAYNNYTPNVGDDLILIYANNGVQGRFSALNAPAVGRWIPVYNYYDLDIIAIQPSFAALGLTSNQKAVGSALDSLYGDPQNDALMLSLGTQDASTLRPEYDLISPEQLTAVYPVLYSAAQSRALAVEGRLSGIVGVNAPRLSASQAARLDMDSPMYADSGFQGVKDRRVLNDAYSYRDRTAGRWGSFLNTTEDLANIGDDANAAGYKFTVTGITAGVDYRISKDMAVGLLLGYDLGSSTSSAGGKLDLNAGHAGLYGGWGNKGLHVEALAEAGLPNLTSTRLADNGTATATATGLEFSGWLNGGYDFKMGDSSIGLYAGGQYTYASMNAFTETGSDLPLAYPSQDQSDVRGDVGIRASRAWKMGSMVLTPNLGVAYEHQFDGYQDEVTAAFARGGSSFTVQGPVIGQDDIAVGAGLNLQIVSAMSAFVQYDGKFTLTNYDRQNFSGGVNIGF